VNVLALLMNLLLEIIGEPLLSGLARVIASTFPHRWQEQAEFAALGYTLLGIGSGVSSIWLFPNHEVRAPVLQALTLVAAPLLCAATLSMVGWARHAHGKQRSLLDDAKYGALFGLTVQLVRLLGRAA
jgi:hypothetical protein